MTATAAVVSESPLPGQPEPGRRRLRQMSRRLGWGVADQGVSSISNFMLGLFAAHSLSASAFGAFSLAFVTYSVVLNAARGLATDPFVVRFSGVSDDRWRRFTASATGSALTIGLIAGAMSVIAGLLLPAPIGPVYIALGVGLPGLALQDSWRFVFFAAGRGAAAFVNDLVITALLGGVLLVLWFTSESTASHCLIVLGATATVGALIGLVQTRVVPNPFHLRMWLRDNRHLSFRYFVENVSISGAGQIRSFVVGAVASLASVGYLRASEILMGPVFVLLSGLSQVAVPEASRALQRSPQQLRRFCFSVGAAQAAVAVGWGVVLLIIVPSGLGHTLVGAAWDGARPLLPAISISVVAIGFANGAAAGLRAMGVARRSLRVQLIGSSGYVVFSSIGALLDGAVGASWGTTLALLMSAAVGWHQLRAAIRLQTLEPAPRDGASDPRTVATP